MLDDHVGLYRVRARISEHRVVERRSLMVFRKNWITKGIDNSRKMQVGARLRAVEMSEPDDKIEPRES